MEPFPMRHEKITAAAAAPKSLQPTIFICTCCETNEHNLTEELPQGWAVEFIDGHGYAFCDSCKIDLPGQRRPAGALATRRGVTSPLDLEELLECDEETMRHAQRLAGIAQAERIGRAVMPILLGAICLGIAVCGLVQGTKWITM
jgi:hypothetical protein